MDIKNNKPKKKGFTLTELIVVIAIIAILAAVLIPTITGYIEKARVSNDKTKAEGYNDILELNQISNSISKDPIEINTKADLIKLLELEDENLNPDFSTSSKDLHLWYDKKEGKIIADTYENIYAKSEGLVAANDRTCPSEFFKGYFYLNSDTELGKAIDIILTLKIMTIEEVADLGEDDIESLQSEINDKINDIDEKYEKALEGIKAFLTGGEFVFKTYTITFSWSDTGVTIVIDFGDTPKPVIKYTVKFYNGDTEYSSTEVEKGKQVSKPTDPTKVDYIFAGWYTDKECTTQYDFASLVNADLSLYAKWEPKPVNWYTLEFDTNGGNPISSITKEEGTTIDLEEIPNPEKEGYEFIGWLDENDEEVTSITLTDDVKVTASWKIKKFNITWYDEDGETVLHSEVDVIYNANILYPTEKYPTKESDVEKVYTFIGWIDDQDITYGIDESLPKVTRDVEYTAVYSSTTREYTITWIVDGTETTEQVAYGAKPVFTGSTDKAADAQYTYTFTGWTPEVVDVVGEATYTAQFSSTVNKYTITWIVDGTETTEQVAYGEKPVFAGSTDKVADAQYTYTFDKWTPEVINVVGEATYTATYTKTVNTYTVTWLDEDGTLLETDENVAYGTTPTFDGETPTKAPDDQFTYTFNGWTPEVGKITGDTEYKATYSNGTNKYTVIWQNHDGTELAKEEYEYGTTPTYKGATPIKASDAQYTYEFAGWDAELVAVTSDVTYTATYIGAIRTYTVTWLDEDGTELEKDEIVAYGTTPTFDKENPTKIGSAQFTYTFTGWTPEVVDVVGDATYTATYTETVNKYKITWLNENGSLLDSEDVEYGQLPAYKGKTPTKASTAETVYTHNGWTPEIVAVTKDATYTATYTETINKYTVIWQNYDGTELAKEEYEYGATPTYKGITPTKASTAEKVYTHNGWTPNVEVVTGNATYTATFTDSVHTYTITWLDENGNELRVDEEVAHGATPSYGSTPTKEGNAQYSYEFAGWSPAIQSVTGDATYKATFNEKVNEYTITWIVDGKETTEQVAYGETPAFSGSTDKVADAQYTYTFTSWSPTIVAVTGPATYTAQFSSTVNKYTITWIVDGEETTEQVAYGETPAFGGSTDKAADAQYSYEFAGWNPAIQSVTGEAIYTATYTETVNKYTVTWKNDNGDVLETDTDVPYGTTPEYNGETPTKDATAQYTYTFKGWNNALESVEGNVTYTATYTATVNKYTVTWKNGNNVLATETYEYGITPEYNGETPIKAADDQYTYTFAGWSPTIVAVTGNAIYEATYTETLNKYTITWVVDGKTISSEVEYGKLPSYGTNPTKEATAQYSYSFTGWSPTIVAVTGPATYTAQFEQTIRSYTVTWLDNNGNKLATETYQYGATPAYLETPEYVGGDIQHIYTFKGWDPKIVDVVGDATYTAQFDITNKTYKVTWVNWDGSELATDTVAHGDVPSYKGETPTRPEDAQYTYTFENVWTPEVEEVVGEITYTAQFTATPRKYTVKWVDYDNSEIKTETVEYGKAAIAPSNPSRNPDAVYSYTFTGWDKPYNSITGDLTITAVYSSTPHVFDNDCDTTCNNNCGYNRTITHSYSSEIAEKPATCTEEGLEAYYTCTVCDKKFQLNGSDYVEVSDNDLVIAKKGHTEVIDAAVEATCTSTGLTEGKHCSVCNEVLVAQTVINALGHNMSTSWSYNDVNHFHKCNNCDYSVDSSSHTYSATHNDSNNSTLQSSYSCVIPCTICQYKKIVNAVAATMKNGVYRYYTSIEAALGDAVSGDIVYVLPQLNITINNDCTIASGVTLVIPYSITNGTANYDGLVNGNHSHAYGTDSYIKTKITVNDAIITNNGTLKIGGIRSAGNGGAKYSGQTTADNAQIVLSGDSSIINNGVITNYGYIITNSASEKSYVENKSGGTITIPFIVLEHRGGSIYYGMYKDLKESPFNRFYMPNIVGTTIHNYNSKLIGAANLYAGDQYNPTDIAVFGNNSSSLVYMPSNTVIHTKYDSTTEITEVHVYGNATLNSLSITIETGLASATLSTENVFFPISHYYHIYLHNNDITGNNAIVSFGNQDIKLMPGAKLEIDEGVTLNARNIVVYDEYLDKNYASLGAGLQYPQDKGAGQLIINGILNVNDIAGYVQTNSNTGVMKITGNTTISTSQLDSKSGSSIFTSVTYITVTNTLSLDYYDNTNINTRYEISEKNIFISTIINNQNCWIIDNEEISINYDISNYGGTSTITNNNANTIGKADNIQLINPTTNPVDNVNIFIGWYDNPSFTGSPITTLHGYKYNSNITLYGKWEQVEQVNVVYHYKTGDGLIENIAYSSSSYLVIEGTNYNLLDITVFGEKIGYEFTGWNTKADGTGEFVTSITNISDDTSLYATYKILSYTITVKAGSYVVTEGTFSDGSKQKTIKVAYYTSLSATYINNMLGETPTVKGWLKTYKWKSWSDLPNIMPGNDITITANY